MPPAIKCAQCGRQFNATFKRCPFCNQPVEGVAAAQPAPAAKSASTAQAFDYAAAAEQAIKMGSPLLALEFHPAGVVALDAFLELTWGNEGLGPKDDKWIPAEGQGKAILGFGAFFGELMRRELGGQWRPWNEQPGNLIMSTLVLPGGMQVFPIAKVFKRLKNGAEDQLEPLYLQARRTRGVQGSGYELTGWLKQASHFEAVKRHDIAARFYDRAMRLPLTPKDRGDVERLRTAAAATWEKQQAVASETRKADIQASLASFVESGYKALVDQHVLTEGGTATLVTAMDRFIDDMAAHTRAEILERNVGAFLGDLLCKRYGGAWHEPGPDTPALRWQVAWPSGVTADPFAMIRTRLQQGGKSLLEQMAALEKSLAERGDAKAPPENPSDWMAQADAYARKPPRLDLALMFASVALQAGGDGPAVRLKLARWCNELGRLPQARTHLDAGLALDSKLPGLWLERARLCFNQKALDQAEADAARCLELDPAEARAHLVRAACLIARGQNEAALAEMERAMELAPQSAEVLLGKAGALLTLGRAREALEWTRVFAGRSDCEPARTRLAALAAEQAGEPVTAHELYSRLKDNARLSPEQREQANARALALEETKEVMVKAIERLDLEPAIEAYARVSQRFPALAGPWRERGVGLAMLNRTDQALECFNRAIELEPGDPVAYDQKAVTLARLKRLDEALAVLDQGLRVCPKSGQLWCRRGIFLNMSGRNDESAHAFEKSLEVDPGHLQAWVYRGDIEAQQGRREDAIRSLTHFLGLKRGSREKIVEVARRQLWSLQHPGRQTDPEGAGNVHDAALGRAGARDYAGALALFDRALGLNPFAVDVWINRGTCLGLLSRHEEALKSFLEAENIGGPLSSQMRGAASALEKLGRKDEAIHCLDRCLANTATTDWDVLRDKAKLLVRFGRAAEALPIYMQLVAHAPKDAALMIERAKALEAAGKTLEARTALEAAQAVTPKPA